MKDNPSFEEEVVLKKAAIIAVQRNVGVIITAPYDNECHFPDLRYESSLLLSLVVE